MMEKIEYLLNFFGVLLLATGVCQEKITKDKRKWTAEGLLLTGMLFVQGLGKNDIEIFLINSILAAIAYLILIEGRLVRKIVIYLFSNYYLQIFDEPINILVKIFENHYQKIGIFSNLLQSLLIIVCVWIVSHKIRKRERWVRWIEEEVPVKYYIVGFLCAFLSTGFTAYIELEIENKNRRLQIMLLIFATIISIFFYAMGILLAIINTYREHYKKENILKDEYLRLSKKHYESLSNNIREVRSLRHDMRAHFNAMAYLIEKEEWEKLSGYVEDARAAVDRSAGKFINVNHDLVNAILTDALAGREGIEFHYEGGIPGSAAVDDFDLCTIFSNLISNSLEACSRLKERGKEIRLEIKSLQSSLYIRMENPVEQSVDTGKLGGWTTKSDRKNHGYGVQNIRAAVEKYHGALMFQCEEGKFCAEIILCDVLE